MQNNRFCQFRRKLILGTLCLFFILYQRAVYGYSFDTTYKTDCANCHSIRKSKAKAGTWAIRRDVVRDLDSTESIKSDRWACDVCHQSGNANKRFDFSVSDTSIMPGIGQSYVANKQFPSSHPVPVLNKNFTEVREEYRYVMDSMNMGGRYRPVMYCTNCHDPLQVGRGIHKTYVSIYRLKFSGTDSTGVKHNDPDPSDDTVFLGTDSTSWFWSRPFDTADVPAKGTLKFGLIPHQGSSQFNPKNSREANKERVKFDTLGLQSIYFCATCHDSNGFPQEPTDTATDALDSSGKRILPQNFTSGLTGFDPSDASDSLFTPSDGGHVIQALGGTNTGLKLGDKLPCVSCHESHGSKASRRLLKESFSEGEFGFGGDQSIQNGIEVFFCQKCHNPTDTTYYKYNDSAGVFLKNGAVEARMLPLTDTKGRDIAEAHQGNTRKTCYSFVPQDQQKYWYNGGCHKDPHRPTMFCNACHQDHFDTVTAGANTSHPVGVMLTATPLPGDTVSIRDYYTQFGDTSEVPIFGGANGYYNGYIDCYTCHNDHSANSETTYAVQMQGLLRGDAGPSNAENKYPNHNTSYNERLRAVATSDGGLTNTDFNNMKAMPELCINCHFRIVGVKFNHGGFGAGGFGRCDKCHSMHGQHPEPALGSTVDSTNLARDLRYGMYLGYNTVTTYDSLNNDSTTFNNARAVGKAYATVKVEWDTAETIIHYTTYVYQDVNGKWFSNRKNDHLVHDRFQQDLCARCHGNSNWKTVVDTTGGQKPPPQIFFDTTGLERFDSLDTYYTSYTYEPGQRNKTTHPVDLPDPIPPGFSAGGIVALKCGSGTKGSGCHNPHGNSNYAQLNARVLETASALYLGTYGSAVVPYSTTGTLTTRTYVSGMHTFCSLCHDLFGCNIYNSTSYDTVKGRYNYTRHPVGNGVSLLVLYDSADRGLVDSAFFGRLVLDYDTNSGIGYPSGRPDYNDFLTADTAKAAKNFIVTCVTCHRQHGSPNLHLRKFTDKGVLECVGCHSKSPDILK